MHPLLRRLGSDVMHLIAPALCPACNRLLEPTERSYCARCRRSLEPAPFPRDLYLDLVGLFPADEIALDAVGALFAFRRGGPVQELVHALKYNGAFGLGVELGRDLGRGMSMFREFRDIDMVVPVPLHRARRRERGFNQAEALGRGIASTLDLPIEVTSIVRQTNTRSQTRLDAEGRVGNVARAFHAIGRRISGARILLCDDVLTTGATLNSCADALLCAGARSVVGACLARDIVDTRIDAPSLAALLGG